MGAHIHFTGTEWFAIPLEHKQEEFLEDTSWLLYAPLADAVCLAADEDINTLQQVFDKKLMPSDDIKELMEQLKPDGEEPEALIKAPEQYVKMSILPTYQCNLACKYCYSTTGRATEKIEPEKLMTAIDFFLTPGEGKGKKRSLFVSGGGEPLLAWQVLEKCLGNAFDIAKQRKLNLEIHFITNGSVMNQGIINFLKRHPTCTICVSFEILEEVQNEVRGKYKEVCASIDYLIANGILPLINSTITPRSVNSLHLMVEELSNRFPQIHTLTTEPVTDASMFASAMELKEFYQTFDRCFNEATKVAVNKGMRLTCSMQGISEKRVNRYCPGKLCLTPMSTFTVCHCTSSPREERYEDCNYGEVNATGSITFDRSKFTSLIARNASSNPRCNDCFARFNCGGGCMTRSHQYPESYLDVVCNHTRQWLLKELLTTLCESSEKYEY